MSAQLRGVIVRKYGKCEEKNQNILIKRKNRRKERKAKHNICTKYKANWLSAQPRGETGRKDKKCENIPDKKCILRER